MTAGAEALWRRWYTATQAKAASATPEAAGQIARTPSFALRIAMLLSWDTGEAGKSAVAGAPWRITEAELRPATNIAALHLDSVIEIADKLAENRDMRDRRSVLASVTAEGVPLGSVTRRAKVMRRRALELLDTVIEENLVVREEVDGRCIYRRTLSIPPGALPGNVSGNVPAPLAGVGAASAPWPPPVVVPPLHLVPPLAPEAASGSGSGNRTGGTTRSGWFVTFDPSGA